MPDPTIDWSAGRSLRAFIGGKDYAQSRAFYRALGFEEIEVDPKMCVFNVNDRLSFYLQDYYDKDWIENSMLFLEVADLDFRLAQVEALRLPVRFPGARVSPIQEADWGREFFVHDPSGVLWHSGNFK